MHFRFVMQGSSKYADFFLRRVTVLVTMYWTAVLIISAVQLGWQLAYVPKAESETNTVFVHTF